MNGVFHLSRRNFIVSLGRLVECNRIE